MTSSPEIDYFSSPNERKITKILKQFEENSEEIIADKIKEVINNIFNFFEKQIKKGDEFNSQEYAKSACKVKNILLRSFDVQSQENFYSLLKSELTTKSEKKINDSLPPNEQRQEVTELLEQFKENSEEIINMTRGVMNNIFNFFKKRIEEGDVFDGQEYTKSVGEVRNILLRPLGVQFQKKFDSLLKANFTALIKRESTRKAVKETHELKQRLN